MKRWLWCGWMVCVACQAASAHVLDQYLQVAQIGLAPDRVRIELRLIPGVQVADRICAVIDADGDGQIAAAEEQAYAKRVWQDLTLAINGVNAPLTLNEVQFPTQQEMREGLGTIRLTLVAAVTLNVADRQQLDFRNNHMPEFSVYLVNALVPAAKDIKITGQERDPLQREIRLSLHQTGEPRAWPGGLLLYVCLVLFFRQWKYLLRVLRRYSISQMGVK